MTHHMSKSAIDKIQKEGTHEKKKFIFKHNLWMYAACRIVVQEKNFMSYHHVVKDSKKARKSFQEDLERYVDCNIEKIEGYIPEVKRMYRCKAGDTWMYAEARYGGSIG